MRTRTIALILTAALVPACDAADREPEVVEGTDATAIESEPVPEPATPVGVDAWDTNGDRTLSRDEWDAWYSDHAPYDAWNTDAEDGLTRDELASGILGAWDVDDDGELTESEWHDANGTWAGDRDLGDWDAWDANGDSVLDASEVAEGVEREGLYDTVDRDSDALIDDEELADWWFDLWDANHDASIDTTEWDRIGDHGSSGDR